MKKYTWFQVAGIRVIKTRAQTVVSTIGTSVVMSDVNWQFILSALILAGILFLLTSLGGLPEVNLLSCSLLSGLL